MDFIGFNSPRGDLGIRAGVLSPADLPNSMWMGYEVTKRMEDIWGVSWMMVRWYFGRKSSFFQPLWDFSHHVLVVK